MAKVKIYFGAPLFSVGEQLFNKQVVKELREEFGDEVEIYLPQENEAINDKSGYADSKMIALADTQYLDEADILIAVLDGAVIDPGLASEIGYAYAMRKSIIGLYTDVRQGTFGNQLKINALDQLAESQFSYANLYTVGLVKLQGELVATLNELKTVLREEVDFHKSEQDDEDLDYTNS